MAERLPAGTPVLIREGAKSSEEDWPELAGKLGFISNGPDTEGDYRVNTWTGEGEVWINGDYLIRLIPDTHNEPAKPKLEALVSTIPAWVEPASVTPVITEESRRASLEYVKKEFPSMAWDAKIRVAQWLLTGEWILMA